MIRAQRSGFTLIEVLIALAVVALALLGLTRTAALEVSDFGALRERTLAGWVAANVLAEARLSGALPPSGDERWPRRARRSRLALDARRQRDAGSRNPPHRHPRIRRRIEGLRREPQRIRRSDAESMNLARARGFSLIELLVALAVFAALAAAAYGGLAQIAATRGALAKQQDRFAQIVRAVSVLERDLRQAISRPVRGNGSGEWLPALEGAGDRIELTRVGFANPLAEPRSNLERVAYASMRGS